MIQTIKKFFRSLFNSKKVTKKSYTNSEDLIKQKLDELKSNNNSMKEMVENLKNK